MNNWQIVHFHRLNARILLVKIIHGLVESDRIDLCFKKRKEMATDLLV